MTYVNLFLGRMEHFTLFGKVYFKVCIEYKEIYKMLEKYKKYLIQKSFPQYCVN